MPAKKKAKTMNWMHYLFLLGLILSVLGAIFVDWNWVFPAVLIVGLVIGIGQLWATKETTKYLVGVIAFVLVIMATAPILYGGIVRFLQYVLTLITPGTILVAIKAFWENY